MKALPAHPEPTTETMSKRTVWIADAAYLLKASKPLGHFDYLGLKRYLEDLNGEPIDESYYLNATPNPPSDLQDGFHNWLKTAPPSGPKMRVKLYQLKELQLHCPSCSASFQRSVQKGVDVGIATLIVKLAAQNHYDRLILSAGDGDFEDAIIYATEEMRKEFWIAAFQGSLSADMQMYSDKVIWLDQAWQQIRKQN
jgi:nijmegen breakage syndrome protein 1